MFKAKTLIPPHRAKFLSSTINTLFVSPDLQKLLEG
jgi:hypothetical protein